MGGGDFQQSFFCVISLWPVKLTPLFHLMDKNKQWVLLYNWTRCSITPFSHVTDYRQKSAIDWGKERKRKPQGCRRKWAEYGTFIPKNTNFISCGLNHVMGGWVWVFRTGMLRMKRCPPVALHMDNTGTKKNYITWSVSQHSTLLSSHICFHLIRFWSHLVLDAMAFR